MAGKPRHLRRREAWREVIYDTRGSEGEGVAKKRLSLLERWERDRWAFFTDLDLPTEATQDEFPLGRPIIWTVDEIAEHKADTRPIKPFPSHKEYLREVTDELWLYRLFLLDKTRQKYLTTLASLNLLHYILFQQEREVVVSRVKEDSAVKLINDKMRKPWAYMPAWLREALPISDKPAHMITATDTGSTVTGVAQNFAISDARGITASIVFVDEVAYQEFFPSIYQAVQPMNCRLWGITTANIGNPGAQLVKDLLFDGRAAVEESIAKGTPLPGVRVYRQGLYSFTNSKSVRVMVQRLGVDTEEDTPVEIEKRRKTYATDKDWRREQEGDWSSPAGMPYFPTFTKVGREHYIHKAECIIKGPVFRAYDFGRRRPAAVWFQYQPKQDRIWGYREFMPQDALQTHEFRDVVKYLSGQYGVEWETLNDRQQFWVERYREKVSGEHCPPPWFPPGTEFVDIGGKEANQIQSNALDPDQAVAASIFAAGDMPLTIVSPRVLGRNRMVDRMLTLRADGWPGMWLDPQMEEVIAGFSGAFAYPEATKAVPVPVLPKNDGHFINLLDAWGYGVVAVVPEEAPGKPEEYRTVGWSGHDPVLWRPEKDVSEVGWSETRGRY